MTVDEASGFRVQLLLNRPLSVTPGADSDSNLELDTLLEPA